MVAPLTCGTIVAPGFSPVDFIFFADFSEAVMKVVKLTDFSVGERSSISEKAESTISCARDMAWQCEQSRSTREK